MEKKWEQIYTRLMKASLLARSDVKELLLSHPDLDLLISKLESKNIKGILSQNIMGDETPEIIGKSKDKKQLYVFDSQGQEIFNIATLAKDTSQFYVNYRWLGGMLTNWKTISISIKRLKDLDERLAGETQGLTKKELLNLTRERDCLLYTSDAADE